MSTRYRILDEWDKNLIEQVKQIPSLYNPDVPRFHDVRTRDASWKAIGIKTGADPVDALRRWKCLRDKYTKMLRLAKAFPEDQDVAKTELFQRMTFLREFIRERKERWHVLHRTTASIECPAKEEEVTQFDDNTMDELNHYSVFIEENANDEGYLAEDPKVDTFKSFKRKASDNEPHDGESTAIDPLNRKISFQAPASPLPSETEEDYFSKSVAAYLKQLSRKHKIKAKVEIFQVLEKYVEIEEAE